MINKSRRAYGDHIAGGRGVQVSPRVLALGRFIVLELTVSRSLRVKGLCVGATSVFPALDPKPLSFEIMWGFPKSRGTGL